MFEPIGEFIIFRKLYESNHINSRRDSVPIFISCKDSDKYNEMALNELNVYASKFGGENSYKFLVATKEPIKSPVSIRAKEMGIHLIIFDGDEDKFIRTIKAII